MANSRKRERHLNKLTTISRYRTEVFGIPERLACFVASDSGIASLSKRRRSPRVLTAVDKDAVVIYHQGQTTHRPTVGTAAELNMTFRVLT